MSMHWRVAARLTAWLRSQRSLIWWPILVEVPRGGVRPGWRDADIHRTPGRTWSDSYQEVDHGRDRLAWAASEAAKGIGPTDAGAGPGLEIVHPHAAGIDVGHSSHDVAVRPDRDPDSVRRFECFTAELHRLADWLPPCGVTTVAMQSTGVYWIALYEILEARGLDVYLVNARHTKNRPGRKTRCPRKPMAAEAPHLRAPP